MTTDTAVRVTRIVVENQSNHPPCYPKYIDYMLMKAYGHTETLGQIPYADYPELKLNKNEATQMPFRYVKGGDGQPVMPEVGFDPRILIKMITS